MTFEKKVINATHPRNVILESTQGRIWVNTPLRDMLCYGQNPNVPLEKKYLVTDGQHSGRLMTQQFLKQTGSHRHFHEPFVKVYTDDLSTFDVDNGIQLDQSSLRSSYSFPQIQNFLVYADFIKNRPVGSIRTGLLIAVNNPGLDARLYGASYSHFNSNPLFMPTEDVVRNNFNFVVRDDNGAIMDFDWGTTSLELHFRRRRNAKLGGVKWYKRRWGTLTHLVAFTMLSFKDDTMVMFSNARGEMDNTPYDFSNTLLQSVNLQDTEVGLKDISFPSYVHVNHEDYQWIITKDTMTTGTFHGGEKMSVSLDTTDPRHKAQWLAQDRILWFSLAHGSIHTVKEALQRTLGQANKLFYDHDDNYDSARDFELVLNGNIATIHTRDGDAGLALFFNRRLATLIGLHTREPQKMNSEAFTVVRMPNEIIDAIQGLWHRESIDRPFGPSSFSAICGVELVWRTQLEHVHGRRHSRRRIWRGHVLFCSYAGV